MKAVTLRLFAAPAGQNGYIVALHDGEPSGRAGAAPTGVELARTEPQNLEAAAAALQDLQGDLLREPGRIPDFDARARHVGALLLPAPVRDVWLEKMREAAAAIREWTARRDEISKKPHPTDEEKRFAREHPGTRTYLQIETPDLARIPWEVARVQGALFLKGEAPALRFVHRHGNAPRQPDWQVRTLIVVAAKNADAIGASEEVRVIRRACRPLDRVYDVDLIEQPNRAALAARIEKFKPHILHFIGHGADDALLLWDGKNTEPWGPTQMQTDLAADRWIPEFAYLNACRTYSAKEDDGAAPSVEDQPLALKRQQGIVDTLLGLGVGGVLAMQADVRGTEAASGARTFYEHLVQGEDVDVAVARGRASIARQTAGKEDARGAYLPVLTLTVSADRILRHRSAVDKVPSDYVHNRVERFIDRYDERRRVVDLIEKGHRLIVLHGGEQIGKSWLLCWTIEMHLRRQRAIRYLELGGCADWLEVFRALRDGNPKRPGIQDSLRATQLLSGAFDWKLQHLAEGREPPDAAEDTLEGFKETVGPLADLQRAQPARTVRNFEERVCRAFHEALRATPEQPLTIVLDELDAGDKGFGRDQFELLRSNWFDPLIVNGDGSVRLLLALRTTRLLEQGLSPSADSYPAIPLPGFSNYREWLGELFLLKLTKERTNVSEPGPREAEMLELMEDELSRYGDDQPTGGELGVIFDALWVTCQQKWKKRALERQA